MRKFVALLLAVLLACMAFAASAEETPYATVGEAVADSSFIYSSDSYYVVLVEKDGAWWRVDGQLDDRYRELYSSFPTAEDPGAVYEEMTAYEHSLPVASFEKLSEQPLGEETLKSYAGKKMKDLLADGFGFDWAEGFTADEEKADGHARVFHPSDRNGTVYRIPFYLTYTEPEYTDGLTFRMNMGMFGYLFTFGGTEETLQKAIENGAWEEMEITNEGTFGGFSMEAEQGMRGDINARLFPTEEEAAAIRTVGDAMKYDYIGFFSDNYDEHYLLINGKDRFWLATAELDEHYRELSRTAYNGDEQAANDLADYTGSLPVTVKALEGDHPPVPDPSAFVGRTVGELQAEGFRICWFYATTLDPAKEEYNKTIVLTDAGGEETVLNGFFSYDDYNEYCLLDTEKGMYQYTFSFDGTAETLEEAFSSGTFTDLAVREAAYSGLSDEVLTMLGLR